MGYWVLYLCSIADSIHTLFCVVGGVILGVIAITSCVCLVEEEINPLVTINKYKGWFVIGLFGVIIGVITPSTNKCYAIFGVGTVLNYVNNNDEAKKIPDNAMKAVNRYLESITPNDSIQ